MWAAVLATTALLRFVACTRIPFRPSRQMYRPTALDFSRSSSSFRLIAIPYIQERLPDYIHQQLRHLSRLRHSRRLLTGITFARHSSLTCSAEICFSVHGLCPPQQVLSVWSVLQLRSVSASASGVGFSMTDAILLRLFFLFCSPSCSSIIIPTQ